MSHNDWSFGDTTGAEAVFAQIDDVVKARSGEAASIEFTISGSIKPIGRREAELWVNEASADGYRLVRYVVKNTDHNQVTVDLVAIK